MELDKLSTGEKVSAVSAVLLFIFMFFDWFGAKVSGFTGSIPGATADAWQAFDVIDIILLVVIAAAIGVAVIRLTDADVEPPVSMNTIVAALGAVAVVLIIYRMINPPGGGSIEGVSVDITLKFGIFLGLIAAAGIAYGGYSAMREEGMTFGDAADRLSVGAGSGGAPGGAPGAGPTGGGAPPPPPPPSSTPPTPPPPPSSGA